MVTLGKCANTPQGSNLQPGRTGCWLQLVYQNFPAKAGKVSINNLANMRHILGSGVAFFIFNVLRSSLLFLFKESHSRKVYMSSNNPSNLFSKPMSAYVYAAWLKALDAVPTERLPNILSMNHITPVFLKELSIANNFSIQVGQVRDNNQNLIQWAIKHLKQPLPFKHIITNQQIEVLLGHYKEPAHLLNDQSLALVSVHQCATYEFSKLITSFPFIETHNVPSDLEVINKLISKGTRTPIIQKKSNGHLIDMTILRPHNHNTPVTVEFPSWVTDKNLQDLLLRNILATLIVNSLNTQNKQKKHKASPSKGVRDLHSCASR
ncbi:MAG: hypothetical protein AAF490_11800 [Chloroflexota bacterium]